MDFKKLQESAVRVYRTLIKPLSDRTKRLSVALCFVCLSACTTLPMPHHKSYEYPQGEAFTEIPKRPYEVLGSVRTKVDFNSLMTPDREDSQLCKNYFNKAVRDLVKRSKDQGGDAVMQVRSVVFLIDGKSEYYKDAQCADEGGEGQVLAEGIAIRWKRLNTN